MNITGVRQICLQCRVVRKEGKVILRHYGSAKCHRQHKIQQ